MSAAGAAGVAEPAGYGSPAGVHETIEVKVPDIGDFSDVPVITVMVAPGDEVAADRRPLLARTLVEGRPAEGLIVRSDEPVAGDDAVVS